jgi:hypothetical protein
MAKKCLIVFQSKTGNTAEVAGRFKSVFERQGWACEMFNIHKITDVVHPPFDFKSYDFVCLGSGILMHEPYNEILALVRTQFFRIDSRVLVKSAEDGAPIIAPPNHTPHHKIILGPESPKAVVFITYSGYEFGPREAEPALQLLALEIEHLGFKCIGKFCCPGKSREDPIPGAYHPDNQERPNEKDLLKAEMFIEKKLEKITN